MGPLLPMMNLGNLQMEGVSDNGKSGNGARWQKYEMVMGRGSGAVEAILKKDGTKVGAQRYSI